MRLWLQQTGDQLSCCLVRTSIGKDKAKLKQLNGIWQGGVRPPHHDHDARVPLKGLVLGIRAQSTVVRPEVFDSAIECLASKGLRHI